MDIDYGAITFISKDLHFKKGKSSQFCWYHQNCSHILLKQFLKTEEKLKEIEAIYENAIYSSIS